MACGGDDSDVSQSTTSSVAPKEVDTALLDAVIAGGAGPGGVVPGRLAAVIAPGATVNWKGASGILDRETADPLLPDDAVRIASVTKTFTAATVLRLTEKRAFGVDDPIRELVSPESVALLEAGGYDVDAITVRHLLTQTSGLPSYTAGNGEDPHTSAPYITAVFDNRAYEWTRLEQIDFGLSRYPAVGEPGAGFSESDLGYVLLGEIVERSTRMSLGAAVAYQLQYDHLGMVRTWWESDEAQPAGVRRAHQEIVDNDVYDIHPSYDIYGGGGIAASMGDVALFYDALLAGEVFAEKSTLDTMLTIPDVSSETGYALGIQREEIHGHECWGHSGSMGMYVVSCPDVRVTAAVSVNDAKPEDATIDAHADVAALVALVD